MLRQVALALPAVRHLTVHARQLAHVGKHARSDMLAQKAHDNDTG